MALDYRSATHHKLKMISFALIVLMVFISVIVISDISDGSDAAVTEYFTDSSTGVEISYGILTEPDGTSNGTVTVHKEYSNPAIPSSSTSVIIPSHIEHDGKKYNVVTIGLSAFYYCTLLTSVTLPETITTIESGSFYGCTSLEELYFNCIACNDLTSSTDAFRNAGKNSGGFEVIFGDDVTRIPAYLGYCYVHDDTHPIVKSIKLGKNVSDIGSWSFYHASFDSFTVPDSVRTVGSCVFHADSITIGKNVENIGYDAFKEPTTINFNSSECCDFQTEDKPFFSVPDMVIVIGENVTHVPSHLIGVKPGYGYNTITSLTIGNNVTDIGACAFTYCGPKVVTVGDSLKSLENVPVSSNIEKITIGKSIESIPDEKFKARYYLTSIRIPGSVKTIGAYAFDNCHSLSDVQLSDGLISISNNAFNFCYALSSIIIPDSVEEIKNNAFYGCSNVNSITLGKNIQTIGDCAFREITAIDKLILPESLKSVGQDAFSDMKISELTIPKYLTSIGSNAFCGSELIKLTVPCDICPKITTGTMLKELTFTKGSSGISCSYASGYKYTVWNTTQSDSLSVIYEEGITTIGAYTFCDNTYLTKISFPHSLQTVGHYAFHGITFHDSDGVTPMYDDQLGGVTFKGQNSDLRKICITPKSISLDKNHISIRIGESMTIGLTADPSDASLSDAVWSVDGTSVRLSGNTVTGISVGTSNVTVKCNGLTAVCTVEVSDVAHSESSSDNTAVIAAGIIAVIALAVIGVGIYMKMKR